MTNCCAMFKVCRLSQRALFRVKQVDSEIRDMFNVTNLKVSINSVQYHTTHTGPSLCTFSIYAAVLLLLNPLRIFFALLI